MKTKKNNGKARNKSSCSGLGINIAIVIVVLSLGFLSALTNSSNFFDAVHEVLGATLNCLQHKTDHIIDIGVITIIVLVKSLISRFQD